MKINIASHISELLYTHERVNVPGLGGFCTAYKEASIEKFGNITPPEKELSFDAAATFHDDVLIDSIVRKHNLTYAEAMKLVAEFVEKLKSDLPKKAVVLSNVGRLYLDSRGEIILAPSSQNFLEDAFGLPKIQKHPISRHQEKTSTVQTTQTAIVVAKPSKFRKFFSNIWSDPSLRTLLIIVAVFILIIPQLSRLANPENERIDPSIIENEIDLIDKNSTFNPFEKTINNNEITPKNTSETEKVVPKEVKEEVTEEPAQKVNLQPERTVETPAKPVPATTTNPNPNTKNYIIVIGNFSTQINANIAIKEVKDAGYKAYSKKISSDKIRVGVEINCEANEIDAKLAQTQTKYPGAWLMNR
ncbi:MAG: SPOR domain-containing protein [Saprospiraceae bacterium]|nr:SPOR domain-containing protein [Saprospiraceae bacterium]